MRLIPTLDPPEKLRHSFSRISTFDDICELRYALDAITPRSPSSEAQLRGTHVHDVAEKAAKEMLLGAAPAAALQTAAHFVEGPLSEAELAPYLERLELFFHDRFPQRGSVEFWFRDFEWRGEKASEILRMPWCGKIDLMTTEDVVCDYKTIGNWGRRKNEHEARKSLQLLVYCLSQGVRKASFVWLNPKFPLDVTTVEFTDAELEAGFYRLIRICQTIEHRWEHGGWAMNPDSGLCSKKWCDHFAACQGCGLNIEEIVDAS